MTGRSGRADLVNLLRAGGSKEHARFLGYAWRAHASLKQTDSRNDDPASQEDLTVAISAQPLDDIPFLYPTRFEALEQPETSEKATNETDLTERKEALQEWRRARLTQSPPSYLPPRPLKPVLDQILHLLTEKHSTGRVDVHATTDHVARVRPLSKLPQKKKRTGTQRITVIFDTSRHLTPFHQDFCEVFEQLISTPGLLVETITYQAESQQFLQYRNSRTVFTPSPSIKTPCIAFTDFRSNLRLWSRLPQRLKIGVRLLAVTPESPEPDTPKGWRCVALDGSIPSSHAQLHKLAVLLSPTTRIEPALLRNVRLTLLPKSSVQLEQRFWMSNYLYSRHSQGAFFDPITSAKLRHEFATSTAITDAERATVIDILKRHRLRLPEEILLEELASLGPSSQGWLNNPNDWEIATTFFADFKINEGLADHDVAWLIKMAQRTEFSEEACSNKTFIELLSAVTEAEEIKFRPNRDPEPTHSPSLEKIDLGLQADCLVVSPNSASPNVSPLISVPAGSGGYKIAPAHAGDNDPIERSRLFPDDLPVRHARPSAPFVFETDKARVTIENLTRSDLPWAQAVGRDRFGLWSALKVDDATQRLRWIPPGRFLRGSPGDEPGRYNDEGPLTEITLANGYWLFDTPVTQALWQAVMGNNPSRFQSPTRPVETVSWEDAQKFIAAMNTRITDLDLRLPSEAEWESACRAGTTTATYVGPLTILGEHNAPDLDEIAWYSGNCGQGFELENGYDISSWRERQYPEAQTGGTHPVAQKRPNPWGLYDMLGNVDEWCADEWFDYHNSVDITGAARQASQRDGDRFRVIRGGGWSVDARSLRAASRRRSRPVGRFGRLGFRCAGGQPTSSGQPPAGAQVREVETRPGAAEGHRPKRD